MEFRRLTTLGSLVTVVVLLLVGCATQTGSSTSADAAASKSAQSAASSTPKVGGSAAVTTQPAPQQVYFADAQGKPFANDSSISLPTGSPPGGRLYPHAQDPKATIYVTIDGTVPTADNHWALFKPGESGRFISSLDQKTRTYRIAAIDEGSSKGAPAPVSTVIVNWKDEGNPVVNAPQFVVDGSNVAPGASISLPVGGDGNAKGRLSLTCNYLGATVYLTKDGTDPSPKNFWKSDICDGTYVFSADAFTATYKAMAVLRGSESPITTVTVTWTAP